MKQVPIKQEQHLCHVKKAVSVLCGKWQFLVLCRLSQPVRFGVLRRMMPDISEKMLIQTLRLLAEYELISRHDFRENPPRVEYRITDRGTRALKIVPILKEVILPDEEILANQ
ncbi:MAG: winged helix-turn-helix transcriptional regulator [Paracoccaceae bacterium]